MLLRNVSSFNVFQKLDGSSLLASTAVLVILRFSEFDFLVLEIVANDNFVHACINSVNSGVIARGFVCHKTK